MTGKFVIIVLVVLVVAAIGVVGVQYAGYRNQGPPLPSEDLASHVEIHPPDPGMPYTSGTPVMVETTAFGPQPILSMELWVDGELAGVQAAPPQGLNPFKTQFLWTPGDPGVYSLVARSINAGEHIATSLPVTLTILEDEKDENLTSGYGGGSVLPAYDGGPQSPNPPDEGDSVAPAAMRSGSPGEWLTSLRTSSPPAAPELAAASRGCGALLSIHDLSDNEEGFRISRHREGLSFWEDIVVLGSQSEHEWITYLDEDVIGKVTYSVQAFNNQGYASSNLAAVEIDSADCGSSDGVQALPTLLVQLVNLTAETPADMAYCYRSFDGASWSRWPQTGFFMPNAEGFHVEGQFEEFMLTGLEGDALIEMFDLQLECWGWQGDMLMYLGRLSYEGLMPEDEGSRELIGDGLSAEVFTSLGSLLEPPEFFTMEGEGPQLDLSLTGLKNLRPPVEDWAMPFIDVSVSFDPQDCTNHLPPDAQNVFGTTLFCWPFEGYSAGGANPQPYLIWDVTNYCKAALAANLGFGGPGECQTIQNLLTSAEQNNAEVGYFLSDDYADSTSFQTIKNLQLTTRQIPPCDQHEYYFERKLQVRMFYFEPGPDGRKLVGPPSNLIEFQCPPNLNQLKIAVTFETLRLWDVDDGDPGAGEDVEVYGGFFVRSSIDKRSAQVAGSWDPDCGLEDVQWFGSIDTSGTFGCERVLGDGTINLADMGLCQSNWSLPKHDNCYDLFTNNNTLEIMIEGSDQLRIGIVLVDEDTSSGDDDVCFVSFYSETFTYQQWATLQPQPFTIVKEDNGNASCEVKGVISLVGS